MTNKTVPLMTKRIWVYWNETETLIKVKHGEVVVLRKFYKTDEGWHQTLEQYGRWERKLIHHVTETGIDCDGRYASTTKRIALANNGTHPNWRRMDKRHYDYSAIAANY